MFKAKNVDVLNGSLLKTIIVYSVPLMLMSLVQKMFDAVDIMVLNVVASNEAVAAVGATGVIVALFVDSLFGIAMGTRVVLARQLGAGNADSSKKTVSTSMFTAILLGVIVAVAGMIFSPWMLRLVNCPPECYDGALLYLRLYLAAAPAMLVYNYGSAIIQVSGNTQSPLYYMMISGALNVGLNFVLCLVLEQKVAAVAIATALSQLLGAVLVTRKLFRLEGICRLRLCDMRWSTRAFANIMAIGLPTGLHHAIFPLSNTMLQREINAFGPSAVLGNMAMGKVEGLINGTVTAGIAGAVSTFMGQNLGAKKDDRVKKSFNICFMMALVLGLFTCIVSAVFARPLCAMFADLNDEIMKTVMARVVFVTLFLFLTNINACFNRGNAVFGYAKATTAISVMSVFGVRFLWMNLIFPLNPSLTMAFSCYTVSWVVMALFNALLFGWVYKYRFKTGKLKKLK